MRRNLELCFPDQPEHVREQWVADHFRALAQSLVDRGVLWYGTPEAIKEMVTQSGADRINELVVVSAAHRSHPAATAWRGVQRRLLAFARDCGREAEGVALARELAMTTYRTAEEFDWRFAGTPPAQAGQPYPVCDYLISRGADYAEVTSAARWIALSDSLDRHAVAPEAIRCPLTLLGFTSDRLVPIEDLRELAGRAPALRRFSEAPSIFGHDAFLKEREAVAQTLHAALTPLYARPSELAA